jgi:hypothetical protein
MGYEMDSKNISVLEYKEILKKQNLLAVRRILKDGIDGKFDELINYGIKSIAQLSEALSDMDSIEELSLKTGISIDYLALLKKEVSNIIPKPVLIADFPHIQPSTFKRLGEYCIQTSKDYFELSDGGKDINAVCSKTGIHEECAVELCSLCDLIRINGVGPVFSRVLFEAGYRYASEIAQSEAESIFEKVNEVNEIKKYTRVLLGIKEIQLCIDFARLITGKQGVLQNNKSRSLI